MISVNEALQKVMTHSANLQKTLRLPIDAAHGFILAENLYSPIDMPPFRQSAMDGYALALHNTEFYKVIGEVKAGDATEPVLQAGEAIRIFTGAPVPSTAKAVAKQEIVLRQEQQIELKTAVNPNENIREQGRQIKKTDKALEKGSPLNAAATGFLKGLGINWVKVYKKPAVGIVVTGNEFAKAQEPLTYGKIYESNSITLQNALRIFELKAVSVARVADNLEKTIAVIEKELITKDVLLISGGISVGDYDFVGKALEKLKVSTVFHKVKQKPGKPLFFGKKKNKLVFALPGNPAAALSCFYIYVYPALQNLMGHSKPGLTQTVAPVLNDFEKNDTRAAFLKARLTPKGVEILSGQSSAALYGFSQSNALVYIPEEQKKVEKGDSVKVYCLSKF